MTAEDFRNWRDVMNRKKRRLLPEREAAEMLGCSRTAIRAWSNNGAPLYIALACAALAHGLKPWKA